MKSSQIIIVLLFIFVSFSFINCSKDKNQELDPVVLLNLDTISFEHSLKGWELYSWPNGNDWNYSILTGTNRLKSYEEVTENEIIVFGKDSLKMLLDKFPVNEEIFWASEGWLDRIWGGNFGNLSLPDDKIINEIKSYCSQKELLLSIGE
jgi:hypothetical protein